MRNPIRPRDLGAAEALLSAAILFVALFAWGASTDMFSREGLASTDNWAWRLWQVGALLMGIPGVWWLWLGTRRVVWTRGAALGVLALAVFLNVYGNGFFDGHVGDVWKATNPIFLGCTLIAVPVLWRHGQTSSRGSWGPYSSAPRASSCSSTPTSSTTAPFGTRWIPCGF